MATKGYWVNGTSDSLGENNSPEVSLFQDIDWLKLTHKDNRDEEKEVIATYELQALDISERLLSCDYFYWMSASSFELAIKKYPDIFLLRAQRSWHSSNRNSHNSKVFRKYLEPVIHTLQSLLFLHHDYLYALT